MVIVGSCLVDFSKISKCLRIIRNRFHITLNFIRRSYSSSWELFTSFCSTSNFSLEFSWVDFSKILKCPRITRNRSHITLNFIRSSYSSSWELFTSSCSNVNFSLRFSWVDFSKNMECFRIIQNWSYITLNFIWSSYWRSWELFASYLLISIYWPRALFPFFLIDKYHFSRFFENTDLCFLERESASHLL